MFSPFFKDSTTAEAARPSWRSVPLPDATPERRRNVTRLRGMGGNPTCVPPNFNSSMLEIWEELWQSMPQSGKVAVTVNSLLQRYKERCRIERKRPRHSSESPPALLPVSFAQAKDWLFKQQRTQSEALQSGAVNEEAQEVVADFHRSLADQPTSTAALLEQPARLASPAVPPPVMSLGPEPVNDDVRAEERAAHRRAAEPRAVTGQKKVASKKSVAAPKKKAIPPELEERQKRASARMEELGVSSLQVFIFILLYEIFLCSAYLFTFLFFFRKRL